MASENKCVTKSTHRGLLIRRQHKCTAEQERALRDQLHVEIENKTKACSNIVYECSLPRVYGYEYCIRHILQDPNAPFKQCAYLYSNTNKRCTHPAPKYDPKKDVFTNFCFEHSRLSQLNKTRMNIGKFRPINTNDSLLSHLTHHICVDKDVADANGGAGSTNASSSAYNDSSESDVDITKPVLKSSLDIDSVEKREPTRHILDYASDSSSNEDMPSLENTWKNYDVECSDNESIDSQSDDLLKHAGIFTTDEVVRITQRKMQRLQDLYVEQVIRLHHLLREKRRQYLHAMRIEKESLCSIHDQVKSTPTERRLYDKLKALNKYHRRTGTEAILHRKFIEKRNKAATDGVAQRGLFQHKCIYTEGGVKCGERVIPCTKYCRKHILDDKRQILYRSCEIEKSGVVCQEPILNLFEDSTCVLHIELPPLREYAQKKYESDSEDDNCGVQLSASSSSLPISSNNVNTASIVNDGGSNTGSIQSTVKKENGDDVDINESSLQPSLSRSSDEIELFSPEDVETNVTICHDNTVQPTNSNDDDKDIVMSNIDLNSNVANVSTMVEYDAIDTTETTTLADDVVLEDVEEQVLVAEPTTAISEDSTHVVA